MLVRELLKEIRTKIQASALATPELVCYKNEVSNGA